MHAVKDSFERYFSVLEVSLYSVSGCFFFFLKASLCSDDVSSVGSLQRNRRTVTFFPILKGLFTLV